MKIFRSLWFKLIGAFVLVIGVTVAVVTYSVNRAVERQFDRYLIGSGQVLTQYMAPSFAEYYATAGSWDQIQDILSESRLLVPSPVSDGSSRGVFVFNSELWATLGWRLIVVDTDGVVRGDTGQSLVDERFSQDALAQGTPISISGQQVGTLIFATPVDYAPLQRTFLDAVDNAALLAGVSAGGVALLLGTVIFLAVMRPLRRLRAAAEQIADGDLAARVEVRDRGELGTVADAFNQMATGLDQQQQLRQQMVADIAHELRTPITVIQGTLEAMLDGVLVADPSELRDLHGETRRLARLVEDLRILSLADAGQLELRCQSVDLSDLAEEIVSRMTPLAEARGITLHEAIQRPLPALNADADRLAQVLTNLIDNALRYTPQGGSVTLHAQQTNGFVTLSVEDTGPGIASENLPSLFDRFWRGEKSRSRHSGGSGLGLAIARELVELHGGSIDVTSTPGEGATFTITLPIDISS